MRCLSCDCNLSNKEATRRTVITGEYPDLCDRCYEPIKAEVPVHEHTDHEVSSADNQEEEERGEE